MHKINNVINEYKKYTGDLLKLALPVVLGELGHILTGIADVAVISRFSTSALASVSIANSILFTIFIFGLGILNAITIILANKRGQKEQTKNYFTASFTFSVLISILFMLICLGSLLFTNKIGFEKEIIPDLETYIFIVSFSIPGMFIFQGIKEFLQSYEIVKFPNIVLLSSVAVNFVLNILFVFGVDSIIPSLGVEGAAFATLIVRYLMALAMIIYVTKLFKVKTAFRPEYFKELFKTGFPIGAAWMFEFLAFNIISILVGRESGLLAAVHSILITISSTTFALPAAIAIAVSVKTGFWYGAKQIREIKNFAKAGLISGVGFMFIASFILLLFPVQILSFLTNDRAVINAALPILLLVAIYQVFDGLQTVTGGILKGLKLTKEVSFSVVGSYWLIGAPLAFLFVNKYALSLKGYWMAIAVSLLAMGGIQGIIVLNKLSKSEKEAVIENI